MDTRLRTQLRAVLSFTGEWDRFYGALEAHEHGNNDLVNQQLLGLGAPLIGNPAAQANAPLWKPCENFKKQATRATLRLTTVATLEHNWIPVLSSEEVFKSSTRHAFVV